MNPAELEILRTAFAFIPEEMGVALQRSAYSPQHQRTHGRELRVVR